MAVEALANLMAGSSPNREAVRAAGGVPVLVGLLDCGPWKDITERATAAIAELVHTCADNQTMVHPRLLRAYPLLDARLILDHCRHIPFFAPIILLQGRQGKTVCSCMACM